MTISRRGVLLGATAAGAALLAASRRGMAARGRSTNPLKVPPLLDGVPAADGRIYELNVVSGKSEFLSGLSTPTLGINGAYLGPTVRCRENDRVTLRVRNNLTEPTTLHWHGLHLPAASDGGPHQVVEPGAVWETSFAIKQGASLCWYHSHLMKQTGEQVLRGLAGLFLIEDEQSRSLRLPSEYGVDDIPLVIQDRRFAADGGFDYDLAMHDVMMGYKGNVILVNGTADPYVVLRRQRTRLRVLNGSNSRIYTLGRDDGADLVVIGSDGGLLQRPARLRRVRLGPGERLELLVDMQSDQSVRLMSYPDLVASSGVTPGMLMGGMAGNTETFPVIELRAERLETADLSLPERLIQVPKWTAAQAARTRSFALEMPMMGLGAMMGPAGMGGAMGINGRAMDMGRVDERVSLGSIEIWQIRNTTPIAHPFHIHGIQFRTLDRNGRPPLPHEGGLKDTVLVDPNTTVRVITEFSDFSDPRRPYMYHCHILEHEDAGMMGQFVVA